MLGTTNIAPYTFQWTSVPPGSYSLSARATDNQGAATLSAPVSVTVLSPPALSFATSALAPKVGVGLPVTLSATTSSANGAISRVEFYQDSTLLTSLTAAPYSYIWNNAPAGTYSLTAKAVDSLGASTTSPPVSVTVLPGPSVNIAQPTDGAKYYGPSNITLSANATEAAGSIASVSFYQGGTLLGTATSAPFNVVWNSVPTGSYSLTAVATDSQGVGSMSAPVNLSVVAPAITILSPTAGSTINGDRVLVRGKVNAPAYSGVTVNGVIAIIDDDSNFYANNVPLPPGTTTATATVTTLDETTVSSSIALTPTPAGPTWVSFSQTEGIGGVQTQLKVRSDNGMAMSQIQLKV